MLTTSPVFEKLVKIDYLRYVDEFVIGIAGPISLVKSIYLKLENYLKKMGLNLKSKEVFISDITKESIKFLGFIIKNPVRFWQGFKKNKRRLVNRLKIHMDYKNLLIILKNKNCIRLRVAPGENKKKEVCWKV